MITKHQILKNIYLDYENDNYTKPIEVFLTLSQFKIVILKRKI